jgi:hypothetical protein
MTSGSSTSRSERILHDEVEDSKPPAIQRKCTVNPQEANGVASVLNQKQPVGAPSAADHTIRHVKVPRPQSPAVRYATRGSASRLALEEKLDDGLTLLPVLPPERKYTLGNPSSMPRVDHNTTPPAAVGRRTRRTSFASSSDASFSSKAVPVPLSLAYNETVRVSNTTMTSTMPAPEGSNRGAKASSTLNLKPAPSSLSPPPSKPPHPWTVLQHQLHYPLAPVDLSSLEEETSSRSNSLRTRSTIDTLDLILAQRYPVKLYGNLPQAAREDDGNDESNGAARRRSDPLPPPLHFHHDHHHSSPERRPYRRSDVDGYSQPVQQMWLDEKRRQAGGYASYDLDAYANNNNLDEGTQPFRTPPPFFEWGNVGSCHADGAQYDQSDNDGDASLSTAPDPPSLRVRDHVCLRPGAYRMSHGGEARHVDNDSVVSSSLRTHSTFRTNQGLSIVEASLVVDEPLPGDEDDYYGDVVKKGRPHGANWGNSYNYEWVATDQTVEDGECPSLPSPLNYELSTGDVTFFSATTNASPVVEGRPLDDTYTTRAFFRSRKILCMIGCLTLAFLAMALGTVFAVTGFFLEDSDDGDKEGESDDNPASVSTNASLAPTAAPTTLGDLHLDYFMDVALPDYTRIALTDPNTPQSQALEWLRNDTNLESYPLERRLQRFSLATLHFATGGTIHWSNAEGWLSASDECSWYSAIGDVFSDKVCAGNEYRILSLRANELQGTLPPEIELLSSLEVIDLDENILSGFLPITLGRMTNLNELHLCKSELKWIQVTNVHSLDTH